jgi:hypothetical protein
VYQLKPDAVPTVVHNTIAACEAWLKAGEIYTQARGINVVWEPGQLPKDDWIPLIQRVRVLRERIGEILGEKDDGEGLEELLALNDGLTEILERAKGFIAPPRLLLPSQIVPVQPPAVQTPPNGRSSVGGLGMPASRVLSRRHMRGHSLEISSPNFSIGDSDGDSDAEELGDITGQSRDDEVDGLGLGEDATIRGQQESRLTSRFGGPIPKSIETLFDEADHDVASPVEKASKAWVEEEGEIFRKGTRLGVGEDDEDDKDVPGELLKQEVSFASPAWNVNHHPPSLSSLVLVPCPWQIVVPAFLPLMDRSWIRLWNVVPLGEE